MARPEDGDMDEDQIIQAAFARILRSVWPPACSAEFMAVSRDILYQAIDRHIISARHSALIKSVADVNILHAYMAAVASRVPVDELVGVLLLCESERPRPVTLSG